MSKKVLSVRITGETKFLLEFLTDTYKLDKGQFVEMAILKEVSKIAKDETWNGIKLKDYARSQLLKYVRQIKGFKRNEILSRALFLKRVYDDMYKLLTLNHDSKEIHRYIESRIEEAETYDFNNAIMDQLKYFRALPEEKYRDLRAQLKIKLFDQDNKEQEGQGKKFELIFIEDHPYEQGVVNESKKGRISKDKR